MHLDTAMLLLWLTLGAALAPLLSSRLGVPDALLQIGYGILLGALGLIHSGEILALLAELGFVLLMFGAGLEIDFEAIEAGGLGEALGGSLVAFGVLVVSALLVWTLHLPAFYVLVIVAMSIGLGVTVLRETGMSSARVGQQVLLIGSIGELLTLIAMTIFDVSLRVGMSLDLLIELGKLAALFAVGVVFLRYLRAWTWWHPALFERAFAKHDASEVGVRAALVACLAFTALAVWLHVEPILGAFIAGAVTRRVFRDAQVLEHKMSALSSGFFIPIFFVSVGVRFDLGSLSLEGIQTAATLGLLVLTARLLPALGLLRGRSTLREVFGVTLLLGTPLTLHIAIGELGYELGVLDDKERGAVVLLAMGLSVLLPIAFKLLYRKDGTEQGELVPRSQSA